MNTIIQTLTVIATIVLIPTLIASIYGMNFPDMPFQKTPHGFYIVMALCFGLVSIMLWYFKKQDWF